MSQKVNFKLAYKKEIHKFASAFKDDELFTAITQHVNRIVVERPYELFWNDDESEVVLETSADLATAIDYAMSSLKSPTGTPCIRLTIGKTRVVESHPVDVSQQQAVAVSAEAAVADAVEDVAPDSPVDRLPHIKEQLLRLSDSALEQKWTTDLRSAMAPLFCPKTQKLQKPSKICSAEIAVQLALLEKKIPGGLKAQLNELSNKQRKEVMKLDWLDQAAKEQATSEGKLSTDDQESVDAVVEAVTAVKLAVQLSIKHTVMDLGDSDYEYGDEDESDEDEVVKDKEATEDDPNCWITQKAKAIVELARNQFHSSFASPVYACPEEYLRRTKADVNAKPAAVIREYSSRGRIERIIEHLQAARNFSIDLKPPTLVQCKLEKHSITMSIISFEEERAGSGDEEESTTKSYPSIESMITTMLRRSVEDVPEDLQQELQGLKPEQIVIVVIHDWIDRIVEEQTNNGGNIHQLSAIATYPEELRSVVKQMLKKNREKMDKRLLEEKNKMSEVELEQYQNCSATYAIRKGLHKYMDIVKAMAFVRQMLPAVERIEKPKPDPTLRYPQWVSLIKSLNMTEEMKQYTAQLQQLQPSPVHTEIARMIHGHVRKYTTKGLKRLENMSEFMPYDLSRKLLSSIEKQCKKEETSPNEFSPATLAALLLLMTDSYLPEQLEAKLTKLNVKKSTETCENTTSATEKIDENIPPNKPQPHELAAWVKQQTDLIVKKALECLPPLSYYEQQEKAEETVQPAEQSKRNRKMSADSEEFIAKKRELAIREKALQLKEEVFERQVAAYQVKMADFKKKFVHLEKRVEENEEKADMGHIDEELKEMDERLKTIELHGTQTV